LQSPYLLKIVAAALGFAYSRRLSLEIALPVAMLSMSVESPRAYGPLSFASIICP